MGKIVLDSEAFKVLASETRIEILKALDDRPMTVSELSRRLALNKATVHEHLRHLVQGDLVKKKDKEGRKWVYYALSYKGKSLLHPETTTFLVLFAMGILGAGGALWALGNWLAWWATGGDAGAQVDEAGPTSAPTERADAPVSSDPGSFAFLADPAFWLFAGLLAAALVLVAAAWAVRRRARRQGPALPQGVPPDGASADGQK